jgi:hypothetical protein
MLMVLSRMRSASLRPVWVEALEYRDALGTVAVAACRLGGLVADRASPRSGLLNGRSF